ncbi:DUF3073 domain-containing protein [Bifidobacterium sp. ESL0728]|uniref:DUF3073 domain-containing protein n=1 Tax=Bifidobacterium sp. ESL0728 TaxID=2983220 RepID=UPI0023F95C64|nr:DUF3073 domain-containing protein [Bifidobacterium sp. ESL0728]WEV59054.1 DUF3073 domain-containing protein [Bifidobacterium sp. ESL0728]
MGRGRQKAKQKKMARKLKYLTTDTDYDELAKELGAQEPGSGAADPFTEVEKEYSRAHGRSDEDTNTDVVDEHEDSPVADDDLDDYAKWAAEAAAKAAGGDSAKPASASSASTKKAPMPKPHKPIHMPIPSALRKPKPKASEA